jgi:hypothetical protein
MSIFDEFGEVYYAFTKYVAEMTGLTSQQVGSIIRNILKLPCKRLNKGYVVIFWDQRMEELKKEYGLV